MKSPCQIGRSKERRFNSLVRGTYTCQALPTDLVSMMREEIVSGLVVSTAAAMVPGPLSVMVVYYEQYGTD